MFVNTASPTVTFKKSQLLYCIIMRKRLVQMTKKVGSGNEKSVFNFFNIESVDVLLLTAILRFFTYFNIADYSVNIDRL